VRTAFLAGSWLLTRGWVVWLLLGYEDWVNGDVGYFATSLAQMHQLGPARTLVEYPLPAAAVLAVPWLLARAAGLDFGHVLMAVALCTDLAFGLALWRWSPARRDAALLVWVLAVPLLGATTYARFDLLPGVLVGVAVLLLAAHPRVALGAAAVATGVKLWPALLLPGLLAGVRRRRPAFAVVAVLGIVLAGATLYLGGTGRLLSPMTYQSDRGLQIESLAATPAMVLWLWQPGTWHVAYAASRAYEVTGPGVPALLALTTLATALLVAALLLAWWWAWRRCDRLGADAVVWLSLAATTGFVAAGKVLSPQYLLWLLPAAAAGVAVVTTRPMVTWTVLLLVTTALTQLVYPVFYAGLSLRDEHAAIAVTLLVVRNLLVAVLAASAWRQAARSLGRDAQRGIELERQPPGPGESGVRTLR
jgi:Glycosyltransferase family 87